MTKSKKKLVKSYILNSAMMILVVSLLCHFIVCSFVISDESVKNISIAGAICFFLLICAEAVLMSVRLIFKDQDTQIGNAAYVMKQAAAISRRKKLEEYATLYINIQDVKYINQRYGLDNGDEMLFKYSRNLSKYAKQHEGFAGRLGGDNFLVLIKKTQLNALLEYLGNTVIEITVDNEPKNISVKARSGVYEMDKDSQYRNMIFNASMAFTGARIFKKSVIYFEQSMMDFYSKEMLLISDSTRALRDNEFVPFYQPKVDVKTGRICGGEALVRWFKDGKIIMPGEFIEPLERAGAITEIDYRMFELVCIDLYNWIDAGINPVKISTNFSKDHFKDPNFAKRIIDIKDKYKIDGKYLEVELTESVATADLKIIKKFIEDVGQAGISVSIDDFGTGYSSLSMLHSLDVDVVKMDKFFLDQSLKNDGKQFLSDVISIVKHKNESVLFEGVETSEQLEF